MNLIMNIIDKWIEYQMIPGDNKMKKNIVKKINGIKIDIRSDKVLYVTIKDWTIYIDNSTNEKIIDVWNDKKDVIVKELH